MITQLITMKIEAHYFVNKYDYRLFLFYKNLYILIKNNLVLMNTILIIAKFTYLLNAKYSRLQGLWITITNQIPLQCAILINERCQILKKNIFADLYCQYLSEIQIPNYCNLIYETYYFPFSYNPGCESVVVGLFCLIFHIHWW